MKYKGTDESLSITSPDKMLYYTAIHEAGHAVMAREVCDYTAPIEVSLSPARCRCPGGFTCAEHVLLFRLGGFAAWAVHGDLDADLYLDYLGMWMAFSDIADLVEAGVEIERLVAPFGVAVDNLKLHWGEVERLAARLIAVDQGEEDAQD
ncbi:MAG: hypothetical protein KAY24_00285 [Candidatus Eisenbacteria sp.]|nr:hypothetical protein [Candidatus Eisenbacteria bacterium]